MADGDDTYPAEFAPSMVEKVLNKKVDMVVGDRLSSTYFTENKRPFHNFGNSLVRKCINIMFKTQINDIMTGYRAFSYQFVKSFPVLSKGFEIETEMSIHAVDKNMYIENEVIEEKEKEEVKNECAKAKTFANRRKIIVQNAMSVSAEDLSKWTQDAIDGAFESLARQAEIRQKRANKRVMGGASAQINNSKAQGSLDRILRPMRLNNARRKGEKE
jgi:hypothetical protein